MSLLPVAPFVLLNSYFDETGANKAEDFGPIAEL